MKSKPGKQYFFSSLTNKFRRRKPKKKYKNNVGSMSKFKSLFEFKFKFITPRFIATASILIVFTYIIASSILNIASFELDPYSEEMGHKGDTWLGNESINILIIGQDIVDDKHIFVDSIALMIYNPKEQSLGLFNINPDLNVTVTELGQEINLRTIFNNKNMEGDELKYTIAAVEDLLALKVDRYITIDKEGFKSISQNLGSSQIELDSSIVDSDIVDDKSKAVKWPSGKQTISSGDYLPIISADANGKNFQMDIQLQLLGEIFRNLGSSPNLFRLPKLAKSVSENLKTDISEPEAGIILWKLRSLRKDQIKRAYTRTENAMPKSSFGVYNSYTPVIESVDSELSSILVSTDILKEQAKIEILNGSSVAGLANSKARWITNAGGRVVRIANNPDTIEKTTVYIDSNGNYPDTMNELERVFGDDLEYSKDDYRYKHIGDIIIIIGEDS